MQYNTFRHNLIQHATEHNIPILGEFELTANCNFLCSFCYVNKQTKQPTLSTDEWKNIFKNAHDSGLMFANLTGGELFLRDDFIELYNYLYDKGIKITIFTNGSIIPEEVIELFGKKKPQYVAITLYGYDTDSYYEMTKNKQAFANVTNNVLKLKEQNVSVVLRTIPIQFVYQSLDEIIDFVKTLDMNLYFFSYVTKTNCFDFQNQRLSPKELIDFENRIRVAFDYDLPPIRFEQDYKSCAALRSSYFINHLGEMTPCALAYRPKRSVLKDDLLTVFRDLGKELRKLEKQNPCYDCALLNRCNSCYARRLNEEGCETCATYLKEVAKLRKQYYKIGDLTIELQVKYQDYFTGNLEKYSITKQTGPIYHIKTHYLDRIDLPEEKPDIRYKQRYIYQNDEEEILYALDDNNVVMEKFVRDENYEHFDIYFSNDTKQNLQEKEYIFTGIAFMDIASFNGYVPIHGSGIQQKDHAIIFSAPSQTGKSTLAKNWLNLYPDASIFNDDKPIIYSKKDELQVTGSPWSGKDVINKNIVLPLHSIVFLKQGKENTIFKLEGKDKIYYLFRNINRPKDERSWHQMMETIHKIVEEIPMYIAHITKDESAAKMIHNTIYGGTKDED